MLARPAHLIPILLLGLLLAALPTAQADEDEIEFLPGLVAHLQTPQQQPFVRIDRELAFAWNGSSPDARLSAAEGFEARWQGRLFSIVPGPYRLSLYATGQVELTLAGKSVLRGSSTEPTWHHAAPVDLSYGYHPLTIHLRNPAGGASQLRFYWSGPQFELEPVPDRHLVHDPGQTVKSSFPAGEDWTWSLRCGACHTAPGALPQRPAPALTHLRGTLEPHWLIEQLTAQSAPESSAHRKMPYFGLSTADARAIAAALWSASVSLPPPPSLNVPKASNNKSSSSQKGPPPRTQPDPAVGKTLAVSLGCLACHPLDLNTTATPHGGSPLHIVAAKRPVDFSLRWLTDPATINPDHRMPRFRLAPLEILDLAAFLHTGINAPSSTEKFTSDEAVRGRALIAEHRCNACHRLPESLSTARKPSIPLNRESIDKSETCFDAPQAATRRPGWSLDPDRRAAIRDYLAWNRTPADAPLSGAVILRDRQCLGCHARGSEPGIAAQHDRIVALEPALAPRLPALTPPALTGVGDKLHDAALEKAIELRDGVRRPWLDIRMPEFQLDEQERRALVRYLVDHDRIPELPERTPMTANDAAARAAAPRLVTADGFGCTSCHKIGASEPVKVALNAHGTDLSQVGERIRRAWFDRWLRNPARIIPRMEMPAIQQPVRGVLDDRLDRQMAAVWETLNIPGFTPPLPNPVRVARTRNQPGLNEPPRIITDLVELEGRVVVRPLLVGLSNRHNLLLDLERGQLAAWWLGDTARQRTRGKGWYWEAGGASRWPVASRQSDISFVRDGQPGVPQPGGEQWRYKLDSLRPIGGGIAFIYRLQCSEQPRDIVWVEETLAPQGEGFVRSMRWQGIDASTWTWRLAPGNESSPGWQLAEDRRSATLGPAGEQVVLRLVEPVGGTLRLIDGAPAFDDSAHGQTARTARIEYVSQLVADRYLASEVALPKNRPLPLNVVPGFEAIQLPLPSAEMPTGLAWQPDGTLLVASLKGGVLQAIDTDGDGFEESYRPLFDGLPAPYGIAAHGQSVDVITKSALLRLTPAPDWSTPRVDTLADDWGFTADYHDWAVGLPRDSEGAYYLALPCQQDAREPVAARRRGTAVRLVPAPVEPHVPRPFRYETISAGLRFPMGLALNQLGDLFATDNQGNYNPFNELNHLRPGERYGFINKLEQRPGFTPPFRPAAVELPHPWTRSVNGIAFLDVSSPGQTTSPRFGPYAGQLVGCEYNGRSLVRMSLERVGETYQGATYPLSRPPVDEQETSFEGPVVCAISPRGELYVGNLHDSGWGGGQNTGSIVRLRPRDVFPPGLAEVRATPDGFLLRFTTPIDPTRSVEPRTFAVRSYRRISTPAYGGPDVDERNESIRAVEVSSDRRTVRLRLNALRSNFVYELRVDRLAGEGPAWFPTEAHYTLRQIPEREPEGFFE